VELNRVVTSINDVVGEERAYAFVHDVMHRADVPSLFQQIAHRLGGLDLVVYVAAIQPDVGPDEYDTEKDAEVIKVNLIGCIAWCNTAAKRFARLQSGAIAVVGSIAGDRGKRGGPAYAASKAGEATYAESLRNRLSVQGVTVTTIKPGFVDTALTRGKTGLLWLRSADDAARIALNGVRKRASVVYVPARWRFVSMLIRSIPSSIFRRIDI